MSATGVSWTQQKLLITSFIIASFYIFTRHVKGFKLVQETSIFGLLSAQKGRH
jgi:hypothetical protein